MMQQKSYMPIHLFQKRAHGHPWNPVPIEHVRTEPKVGDKLRIDGHARRLNKPWEISDITWCFLPAQREGKSVFSHFRAKVV